jgi:hypothetical protein
MLDELATRDVPAAKHQAPALTPLEESRAVAAMEHRRRVEWLMTAEDATKSIDELLEDLVNRPAWHREAACRGVDRSEIFFPQRGSGRPAEALAYCERCTVRAQCLDTAVRLSEAVVGVWGGTSARERRGLRRGAA